ncbi:MAG: hypothetical protein JWO04_861 [Gammaproteobacteria bacterium]|jgi:hypothetical protein|nr:hypothetical protein [Gammaproteobacteria bacterium]
MSSADTNLMIRSLAREAGMKPSRPVVSFDTALLLGAALSFASAVMLVFATFGIPDPAAILGSAAFHHKISSMLTVACGGVFLVRYAGRPGARGLALLTVLPGLALLIAGAISDTSGFPFLGRSEISVPSCIAAIVALSLLPLVITLFVLKRGVTTRPAVAGATAGVLAGALGAAAYSLVCKNNGGLFVAVWYPTAVLIVVGLGSIIGRRALAW